MSKDDDKIQQARRELFEAAWLKVGGGPAPMFLTGVYIGHDTQLAWRAFNAALDCVEIELLAFDEWPSSMANAMNRECRTAIESTNLGIKIK